VAYVVPAAPPVPAAELRGFLKQQLPAYLVPAVFVQLDALPLTPNGKLDRRALPAPRGQGAESTPRFTAPRTPVEKLLADIWQDVLKLERVGIHDDFFQLGGHSLVAAQIVARIRAACRADLPVRAIFEARTVAELAALVPDAEAQAPVEPPSVARHGEPSRPLPLSFAQERLWFLDQLEPGSPFYNTPTALRLAGPLDAAALGHALAVLIARHDVLRTTFPAPGGEPRAVIEASVDCSLPVVDLTARPSSEREPEARRLATEEARRPFDLARGPLFRARLYRLDRDEHVLLLLMHHIVTDAWSMGVLIAQLADIYRAFAAGASPPLQPQPMQYGEYAAWQRERLQDAVLASQLGYWKARLKGAPAALDLLTDRPRPVKQAFLGARRSRELPASLIAEVAALSRGERATPFMTFLAAFQALLHRYTGQEDLVVGVPIANRTRVEAEDMVGLFVNTLALRADLSGNPQFRELLGRVRQTTLEDYAHQDLPFQRVVEELAAGRDPSRAPLFQVMFQQVRLPTLDLPGIVSSPMEIDRGTAKFDLTLSILEERTGVRACLEYDTALFDDATIERMLGHYQVLLEGIVAGPDRRLSDLPVLGAEERTEVPGFPQEASPGPGPDRCIHQLFEAQVELTPEAIAVVFEDRRLSYRELNAEANRLAHALRGRGVGPEVRVGLCVKRSTDMIVGLLGVLKAGGVYVPLDPSSPGERLARILEEARPQVVLTQAALAPNLGDFRPAVIRLDADGGILAEESEANPECVVPPAAGAYVIYTSGSTGRPKGVVVEHRTVVNYLWGIGRRLALPHGATFAMVQPLTVDSSVTVLFPSLCAGGCLHLISEDRALDAAALSDYFVRNPIDCLKIAPSHLSALQTTRDPGPLLPRRWLVLGGEASQWSWVRQLQSLGPACRILNHYGPTEATVGVLTYLVRAEEDEPRSSLVPMGRPLPNTRAYLLDGHLNPVPPGSAGELHLAGDCLARGYLEQPGITAEKFIPDPFDATPGARMYRTGDLARVLTDGELEFLGRRDDQIKIRGFRIEPKEIEAALRMHPAVREAAVVAREGDGPHAGILVAYVSCRHPAPGARELAGFLRAKLPEYMVPAIFSILDALPRTPQGKLDRRALPTPEVTGPSSDEGRTDAGTPVEDLLAAIWAEVLRRDHVGRRENFFELGGHSLLATRVMSRVRSVLGSELPVRALFEAPTVAGLAARIQTALRAAAAVPDLPITPATRPGRLPLSHMQQRLWFIHQMNPSSPAHNAPLLVRLTGVLDAEALRRALKGIVQRHEALRTTFPLVEGAPVQLVADPGPVSLPLTDLRRLPPADRAAGADRLVRAEAKQPFNLESGPLLRVRLYRLDEAEHLLLISIHHLLTDGSSASVLLHELSTLYEACTEGRASPLPPLPIQYPDYAVWERERLQGEALERLLGYWRRQLAGAPSVLELATDRPRPPVPSYGGARESLALGRELSDGIAALGRREGVTLFMTVTAAFQVLLARYTGQQDIVVGAPIAVRSRQETEGLIGLFLNVLLLRADLSGDPRFSDLLAQVREVALGAFTHQDLPYERLVEGLAPERDPSRNPLFQVVVNRLPPPPAPVERAGVTFERLTPPSVGSRFDLTLYIRELPDEVTLYLGYSTDLFDTDTIVRMLGHLRVLLEGAVAEPTARLSQLPLLSASDRRLLAQWNQTDAETPADVSVHGMFEAQAARTPEGMALRMGEQNLTYRELASRTDRIARCLRSRGVGPDTLVALCLERSLDVPVGVLGILKAGGAYVPLDPAHPKVRLAHILRETRPRLLLTQARLAPMLPPCEGDVLYLEDLLEGPDDEPVAPSVTPVLPDHLAYVVYTSGSTGKPKGVLVRHAGVVNYLAWLCDTYGLNATDVVLQLPSFSYTASVRDLIGPLTAGGQVILVDDLDARSPDALLSVIRSRRVTCLLAVVPALLDGLVEAARSRGVACDSLRLILVSGEALRAQTARDAREVFAPGALVVNQYGPTECTMNATWCNGDLLQSDGILVAIGKPIPNYRVLVLDRHLDLVPIGVPGELYIGGSGLARGYHDRPGLTAERFIPDPLGTEPGGRLYRTGDRARWRPDGNLEFLGRLDHQIKLRGHRIELGEIEAVIAEHPAVRAAAVVLREDRAGHPQLVAYAVASRNGDRLVGELQAFLKERLPVFMVPARFELLESLPLTSTGKVDRRALPPPKALQAEAVLAPRTPVESQVAAVMAQVLGLERLGVDDNFFSLGGHSLLGTQLISRLRGALQVEVPLRTLFEAPTVAGLSAAIETARREGRTPPVHRPQRIARDGPLPLSFAQQRLWFLDRLEPGCHAYNIATAVRLTGPLDPSILERSLNDVVRRHEALRTRFAIVDGSPAQLIAPELELAVPVLDLQHLSGGEQDAEVRRLASEDAERAFDLTSLPLLRASVLRLGEQDHVLLLSMHHIISDGWSLGVLFRELSSLYEATLGSRPAALAPLEVQYPDYAVWQRRRMRETQLEEHLAYWKRQLGGRLPALRLPTDRARPPVRTFHGDRCTAVIPPGVRDALEALGREQEASLFMVLLAAFQTLLARSSGQDDLVVGSPIANRTWAESESLIGFLVNLLALRTDLSGDPTFRELLGRVREVALEAYAHQDLPFDMLVEALQPERDLGRTPIFQALFALHTQPQPALAIPGVVASPLPSVRRTARFDLSLMMRATGTGLVTTLEYSSDLFERATAERMLRGFQALLEAIVADPDRRLSALPFMNEDAGPGTPGERDERERETTAVPCGLRAGERRPRTPLEDVLAALWADALGVDRVAVDEDFFELGGHSLLAAILASRLSGALGREVPVRFLLLHPTVAALARALEEHHPPSAPGPNGAGKSVRPRDPGDRRVAIERRPLISLIAGGEIAPVDAAAISYLPDDLPARTGLTRGELVHAWHGDGPTLRAVLTTSLGRIASIVLPRFASGLYDEPDDLVGLVLRALETAERIGARAVSLTGLIPSATGYGRRIAAAAEGRADIPPVSTGHATTAATVVLAIERILREAGRNPAREHVGVLGLGSIGLTSLRLMLRRLPHPTELTLCDVYAKRPALEAFRRRLADELGFHGSVHLLEARAEVPPAFYDATLMLGATNVAEVLDVARLRAGTLLVDDSGPHCFSVHEALQRLRSSGDILFTEGGVLRAPQPMEALRYMPWTVERAASPAFLESFAKRDAWHITGCVLSGLLSARFADLTPTLGLADDASCARHYDRLHQLGYQAGDLQCRGQQLDDDAIGRFRRSFGATPVVTGCAG
jgi:amino acid adenylation domain-containing protein